MSVSQHPCDQLLVSASLNVRLRSPTDWNPQIQYVANVCNICVQDLPIFAHPLFYRTSRRTTAEPVTNQGTNINVMQARPGKPMACQSREPGPVGRTGNGLSGHGALGPLKPNGTIAGTQARIWAGARKRHCKIKVSVRTYLYSRLNTY